MRTADAMGIQKIYFTGYTPTPIDRFGRARKDFTKASLGAEEYISWEQEENFTDLCKKLKKDQFHILAIEQSEQSVDIRKFKLSKKAAFVLGNEVEGLSSDELSLCNSIAEIPMFGKKESLNVSVAAGIALFEILHKK